MPDSYQETTEESIIPEESKETKSEIKPSLEKEVLELERKLAEKRAEIEKERKIEAEPAKEKIEPIEEVPPTIVPPVAVPPTAQVQQQVKELKNLDRQNQVKTLCDLAFEKNLNFAIEVARSLDNAYVLDEFHDTLVDKLYQELIKRRKLEET